MAFSMIYQEHYKFSFSTFFVAPIATKNREIEGKCLTVLAKIGGNE